MEPHDYTLPVKYANGNRGHQDRDLNFASQFSASYSFIKTQSAYTVAVTIDQQYTDEISAIISNDGDDIYASCTRYFTTIDEWYHIIIEEDFYNRLVNLRSAPMADFSILVFTVYVLSQMYRQPHRQKGDLKQLYQTAKSMHSLLVSTGRGSIELVQSGLLLALFEHTQALHNASFQTIGVCARMGYVLGIHRTLSPNTFPLAHHNEKDESQRLLWWGTIALER